MIKRILGVCLILIHLSLKSGFGQATIKGIITDSIATPVPFTQVLLKQEDSNNVIAYTQSNISGQYSLNITKWGNFTLEFCAISFKRTVYPLSIPENQKELIIIINPTLREQTVNINEVIIIGERPITIKKDTIIFNVTAFSKGNENVAEDILKLLPGMNVSDNGSVTWQGKEVEKIMVGGDDLFGKGYRLISKNMQANVIDKVEVYEHYSHNNLLKDIEESNKVALNLVLREDVRLTIFGNAVIGYSTNNTHNLKTGIMSFGKNQKLYTFGNSNSIGNNPTGDINYFINHYSDIDESTVIAGDPDRQHFISVKVLTPSLKDQRVRDNNSNMFSINTIFSPSKNVTTKMISFGTLEHDNYFYDAYYKYYISDTSFTNTENHSLRSKNINGFGKVELKYLHSKNVSFEYQGQMLLSNGTSNVKHLFNQLPSSEKLNNSIFNTDHRFIYTYRISPTLAINVTNCYQYDERPEDYLVSNYTLGELFPNNETAIGLSQSVLNKTHLAQSEIKSFWRFDEKYILSVKLGEALKFNIFDSQFVVIPKNDILVQENHSFLNKFESVSSDMYAGGYVTRLIGNFSVNISLNSHWLYINQNNFNKISSSFLEPKISFSWQANKKNKIYLYYLYNATSSSLKEIINGYVLIGSRSFIKGTGDFYLKRANTAMVNYSYGIVTDIFQYKTTILYSSNTQNLTTSSQITPNYALISYTPSNYLDLFMSSTSIDFFIKPIQSNLKIKGNYSSSSFINSVNDASNRVNNHLLNLGSEIRSGFKGIFNYHFGTSWIVTQSKAFVVNSNSDNYQFLDLLFKLSSNLSATINAERYKFGNIKSIDNPWHFIDVNITYNYKPNKISFTASANNILNNKEFGNITISDISETGFVFNIVPRYFMLNADIRF